MVSQILKLMRVGAIFIASLVVAFCIFLLGDTMVESDPLGGLRQYFDQLRPSQAYYHYIRNDSNKTLYLMEEHASVEIPPGIEKEAGRPRWVRLFSYDELSAGKFSFEGDGSVHVRNVNYGIDAKLAPPAACATDGWFRREFHYRYD